MRRVTRAGSGLLLFLFLSGTVPGVSEIGRGPLRVTVGEAGVVLSAPGAGIRTVDGPRVALSGDVTEWFGLSFEAPSGREEYVGGGGSTDWAGRKPVESLSFAASTETATTIGRAGPLEVATAFALDETGAYLLARVTITNLGGVAVENVVYSREWRTPGGAWTFPEDVPGVPPAARDVSRRVWALGALEPGASAGLRFSYASSTIEAAASSPATVDVPLQEWTNPDFPVGLNLGTNIGVSWGDYDADGWADLFVNFSATLWRNVGGATWEFAADLNVLLPPTERRYGSSFGDYDNDGLPDIAMAPRVPFWGDDRFHLLHNLGGGPNFEDVADDPEIVDVQPYNNAETLCWADVNGDADLDLFVPVYPPWVASGPGNFFLFNLGPTGPLGAYRFTEKSEEAGLDNPAGTSRPEGAQYVDVDFDGDVDLFSNGTLYQNVSAPDTALFNPLEESESGVGLRGSLDEGLVFFDYDMDGDQDLFVVYTADGVVIWENHGDGTFFAAEPTIVDSPFIGLNLGMSAEDWDNDGDVDFTTRQVFRRNMLMEEGARHFTVATHSIPSGHISSALPAWGDWDKDGDLDCAMGNWGNDGHFYESVLYTPATPPAERRHVRVRVQRDSPQVQRGLETEYGATAELVVRNPADALRRRKFVSSSHGYLNQNDYTLTFAVPPDPVAADPGEDVRFDLVVDFPAHPSEGIWRVDGSVNPALDDINLATLADREIEVRRCGQVVIDGVAHDPLPFASPRLTTTTGGLVLAAPGTPLADPTPASQSSWYTGLVFDTLSATGPIVMKEIILDGQLDSAVSCIFGEANIALWDVTDFMQPVLVEALVEQTSPRNRRSYFPAEVVLAPGRSYRLVARITESRDTPIDAPVVEGPVTVQGGIAFKDPQPCNGAKTAQAHLDETTTSLSIRFGSVPSSTQSDPIGATLTVGEDPAGNPLLRWLNVEAPVYHVLRCSAAAGPCTPMFYGATPLSAFIDPDAPCATDEVLWYNVKVVNECTAEVYAGGAP